MTSEDELAAIIALWTRTTPAQVKAMWAKLREGERLGLTPKEALKTRP